VVDHDHPAPGQCAGEGDRAGQRREHRLAHRAQQVDAAVAGAVGAVGQVEAADHHGLGLQRPDAHRIGGTGQRERGREQECGQGSHADTLAAGADGCRPTSASLWTNRRVVAAVDDSRTAPGVDYS
jgi:hypothetical protein